MGFDKFKSVLMSDSFSCLGEGLLVDKLLFGQTAVCSLIGRHWLLVGKEALGGCANRCFLRTDFKLMWSAHKNQQQTLLMWMRMVDPHPVVPESP